MSPQLIKIQDNMQAGVITQTGFLGDDKRKLVDIIAHDEETLKSLNIDIDELVIKLEYFKNEGLKGLGEPITIDKKWEVMINEARGFIPCPFEDGVFRKRNIQIKNLNNKKILNYSDLSIHLINKHHFFQGHGASYRLNPKDVKEVLEL